MHQTIKRLSGIQTLKTGARIIVILFTAFLLLSTVCNGNEEILAAHNAFRTEVGVDPLMFNTSLAAGARAWAEHDAGIGSLDHSDPKGIMVKISRDGRGHHGRILLIWGVQDNRISCSGHSGIPAVQPAIGMISAIIPRISGILPRKSVAGTLRKSRRTPPLLSVVIIPREITQGVTRIC